MITLEKVKRYLNREKLYQIIFESDTYAGRMFDTVLIITILLSVLAAIIESLPFVSDGWRLVLQIFEYVSTFFFTVEYVLRIYVSDKPRKYIFSFFGIVDLLATLPLYLAFFFTANPLLCAGLMVWKEGFRIIVETAFWVAAFRFGIFNGRPKTLTVILGAQALAALCASGTIYLTADGHIQLLILWAAFFAFAAAFLLKLLSDNGSIPIVKKPVFKKQETKRSGIDSAQKNLYLCFYVLSGLLFFATGVFDYYFLSITALKFNGRPEIIAEVYSSVFALLSGLSFILLILSAKGKASPFSLLYLIPVALLIGATGGWCYLFGLIAAANSVLKLIMTETKETTLQTIPLAVSLRTGFRATLMRKSLIEPLALALCSLFIWYAEIHISEKNLLYFIIALALIVLLALILMRKVYLHLVLNMLKSYLWRGGRLLLTGKTVAEYLKNCLNSSDTQETLYALRVIEEAQNPDFLIKLKQALHHKNEDVRLYALAKVESLGYSDAITEVTQLVKNDESLKVRQTALRVICRLGDSETREKAVKLINDPDLRAGALTGLLAVGQEGVFIAIEQVAALASSVNPADRQLAAVVLGDAGNPAFYHPFRARHYLFTVNAQHRHVDVAGVFDVFFAYHSASEARRRLHSRFDVGGGLGNGNTQTAAAGIGLEYQRISYVFGFF